MKSNRKWIKFITFIGIVCLILGGILINIGISKKGSIALQSMQYGPFGVLSWANGNNTGTKTLVETTDAIKTLNIDGNIADIEIRNGDHFSVVATNMASEDIRITQDQEEITLDFQTTTLLFSINGDSRKLVIYVPDTMKAIDVDINIGDIKVANLSLDELRIDCNKGEVDIKKTIAKNVSMNMDMGDINYSGDFTDNMIIENHLGDVEISLAETIFKYDYDCSSNLGDIEINRQSYDGFNPSYLQNNNQNRLIKVKLDMGDLEIKTQ